MSIYQEITYELKIIDDTNKKFLVAYQSKTIFPTISKGEILNITDTEIDSGEAIVQVTSIEYETSRSETSLVFTTVLHTIEVA